VGAPPARSRSTRRELFGFGQDVKERKFEAELQPDPNLAECAANFSNFFESFFEGWKLL
jgi:hypothetical protein